MIEGQKLTRRGFRDRFVEFISKDLAFLACRWEHFIHEDVCGEVESHALCNYCSVSLDFVERAAILRAFFKLLHAVLTQPVFGDGLKVRERWPVDVIIDTVILNTKVSDDTNQWDKRLNAYGSTYVLLPPQSHVGRQVHAGGPYIILQEGTGEEGLQQFFDSCPLL